MKKGLKRKRHCGQIAMAKARQARRKHSNPIIISLVFIAALVPIRSLFSFKDQKFSHDTASNWPVSDYERGYSTQSKPIKPRYEKQPTFKTLMRDLKRPAAREDATQALLAVIQDNELKGWALEQILEGRITRLSIHVRPNTPDVDVIKAWRKELDEEKTMVIETINDAAHKPG